MFTSFSLILALGVAFGLGWCGWRVPTRLAVRTVDQGLLALFTALIGARCVYVVLNWGYFQSHLPETWQVWLGGLSGAGALPGFMLGVGLAALLGRERLGLLADRLLPLAISLAVSVWLAAWQDGSAYGFATPGWFNLPAQDERGVWAARFPTQGIGALATLGLWAAVEWFSGTKKIKPGTAGFLGWMGISLTLLVISFTRADPAPVWHGLRIDAWAALVSAGLAGLTWVWVELICRIHQRHILR